MTTTRPAGWVPLTGQAHRVALEVLLHGPLSRAELARRVEMSPGSLTRLTRPLLDSGLLVEADDAGADRRPGRPSQPLDVVADSHHFVGVKITGDAAYGVVTTLRADVVARAQAPLRDAAPETVAADVADLVDRLTALAPAATAVGVSVGGHVLPDGTVRRAPFLGWSDVPLTRMLAERTGRAVVAANDVAALTEATHWFGEGRGHEAFAVVTVGAGVGLGVVAHDRLLTGPYAGLGLIGHHPLEPGGPVCSQGHRGCAEVMLTTWSIERQVAASTGASLPFEAVLDAAAAGATVPRRVVDDAGRALGRLLAAVTNIALPEVLVLGGEGARLASVAQRVLADELRAGVDPLAEPPPVVVQSPGFHEWARGAAVVAIQTFVLGR